MTSFTVHTAPNTPAASAERADGVQDGALAWDFKGWTVRQLDRVERAMGDWVPAQAPAGLGEAMRYAVLDGGKRLRPLLTLAAAQSVAGQPDGDVPELALRAACAVELIHAYSLVHDDMPCMDNDVLAPWQAHGARALRRSPGPASPTAHREAETAKAHRG